MAHILKLKDCADCQGCGFQVQSAGKIKGYVRPCLNCVGNFKKFSNQYGTDKLDGPRVYVERKGRVPILHKLKSGQRSIVIQGKLITF